MYLGPFMHQSTGLNRAGRYLQPAREKARRGEGEKGRRGDSRRGDGGTARRGEWRDEKWRRITGIFPHVEMSSKERRAGLARLAEWIEYRVTRRLGDSEKSGNGVTPHPGLASLARPSPTRGEGNGGGAASGACYRGAEGADYPNGIADPDSSDRSEVGCRFATPEAELSTPSDCSTALSFTDPWEFSAKSWGRTRHRGICVEEVCVELGISAARLSALLKECYGLSASEFVDALMIRKLKPMLFEKIRAAAFELWGAPGSYVWEKLGSVSSRGFSSPQNVAQANELVAGTDSSRGGARESRGGCFGPGSLRAAAGAQAVSKVAGRGRPTHQFLRASCASKFFRVQARELFEESRAEERERRLKELCGVLRASHGSSEQQKTRGTLDVLRNSDCGFVVEAAANSWHGRPARELELADGFGCGSEIFDAEVFALQTGFASAARLKRACLNVFGKSLRRLEEVLAEEVLQYYLCAEDKELREIASRANDVQVVFRARELYHESEEAPKAPFLDEWSKFEELKPHWLSRMRGMMRYG